MSHFKPIHPPGFAPPRKDPLPAQEAPPYNGSDLRSLRNAEVTEFLT